MKGLLLVSCLLAGCEAFDLSSCWLVEGETKVAHARYFKQREKDLCELYAKDLNSKLGEGSKLRFACLDK